MVTTRSSDTLVDHVHQKSESLGDSIVYRYLQDGECDGPALELTYRDFDRRARAVAAALVASQGTSERALMLYPAGLDFMVGFFGCLYAGTIAVPAYPPDPARLDRTLLRLRSIAADCKARFVVTTSAIKRQASAMLHGAPELAALTWIATDEVQVDLDLAAEWRRPPIVGSSVAFLQYTSGSTGDPKGVVVSHDNLLHNERMISRAFGEGATRDHVAWLPLYHDMGLIGKAVHAPFAGVTGTFLSPLDFLKRPVRWLRAMSRFRAGFSAAPNFAYELCVRKIDDRDLEGLDLSAWSVAVNAAEPVRRDTLERFAARFAPHGFRREAFAPAYGLAEGTLLVSTGTPAELPRVCTVGARSLEQRVVSEADSEGDARAYVSCGRAWDEQSIRIVDPDSRQPSPANGVGEIWVQGASVGKGYWNREEETTRTFRATLSDSGEGPFLRTGDLGFLRDGELYVSGRLKDLMIVRGRNHLPNDVEHTVECAHAAIRGGCSAAFSIEAGGEETLVVVAEIEAGVADRASIAVAVRAAVADAHDLPVHSLVLIEARTIPKTTSGKIQRRATRDAWKAGTLRVVETFTVAPAIAEPAPPTVPLSTLLATCAPAQRLGIVAHFIQEEIAHALRRPFDPLDVDASLTRLGLDSLAAVELRERLESSLGASLPASIDAESPTTRTLSEAMLASWLGARLSGEPSEGAPIPVTSREEEVTF